MKDITGKILSNSKNKLNNAKAVMEALSQISSKYVKIVPESVVIANKEVILPEEKDMHPVRDQSVKKDN